MELADQVCSYQLAKKLRELGIKQDSFLFWEKCPDKQNNFIISNEDWHDSFTEEFTDGHALKSQEIYSAFSVSELGELLPKNCESSKFSSVENTGWIGDIFETDDAYDDNIIASFDTDTEANARALMLIYLIENKLIEGYQ